MAAKTRGNRKPKARERRPKQGYLSEEMAPVRIAEIDEAAENYVTYRDTRMATLQEEIKAGQLLLALMKKHSLPAYEWEGKLIAVDSKEKISVRTKKDASENGEAND